MECLHGLPASTVSTKNGKFWLYNKNNPKGCEIFCPDQDRSLCETTISMRRANGPIHPVCDTGKSKRKEKIKAAFSSVAQTIEKSRAVFLNGSSSWNTRSTKCIFLTLKELVYCRVIQRYTRTW
jgi:hypothetical protein